MKKAFTIIELVTVVAVLGIIVAVAIPSVSGILMESKIKSALSTARLIECAKDAYVIANPGSAGTISESQLKPHLPAGIILPVRTPFNTEYGNVLNLDEPVSFIYGDKTYYSIEDWI